jgi:hypothetical protein
MGTVVIYTTFRNVKGQEVYSALVYAQQSKMSISYVRSIRAKLHAKPARTNIIAKKKQPSQAALIIVWLVYYNLFLNNKEFTPPVLSMLFFCTVIAAGNFRLALTVPLT